MPSCQPRTTKTPRSPPGSEAVAVDTEISQAEHRRPERPLNLLCLLTFSAPQRMPVEQQRKGHPTPRDSIKAATGASHPQRGVLASSRPPSSLLFTSSSASCPPRFSSFLINLLIIQSPFLFQTLHFFSFLQTFWVWWYISVFLGLGRLRQKDCELKDLPRLPQKKSKGLRWGTL